MRHFRGLALFSGAALVAAPAFAERVETYWRLEPLTHATTGTVSPGQPFLVQRLLPVKLVKLTEPVTVGKTSLPPGTPLYLVFNGSGRIGYCTLKDRSSGRRAKTLFIPILDQRPCFVASGADGRFDKSFSVFDKWGGPPSVRGSIDGAVPLPQPSRFEAVDVHDFPVDMRMSLQFIGSKTDITKVRVRVSFNGAIGGHWQEVRGKGRSDGTFFDLGNVQVLLRSIHEGTAEYEMRVAQDFYISTNNQNTLFVERLPPFVPTS